MNCKSRAPVVSVRPWAGWMILGALSASSPALAQQKSGPGLSEEESLTWRGITLYGVIDIGVQYDTHGAPFSDYRPAASGNIVQKNSREAVFGVLPNNMGQSRVGLQGSEHVFGAWSAVFQAETFFNPQSGDLADSLKSLVVNNGRSSATSGTGLDGSSAGQAFQTAYVGLKSKPFGSITFGRQLALLTEGTIKYDPNYDASAFGLIGASGAYQGGGSTEDKRLDSMLKYAATFDERVHFGALYKFNGASGSANAAFQAVLGGEWAGVSLDAYYSKINDAVSASSLTAAQVTQLPRLGYAESNSVAATISDNTTLGVMALYEIEPVKLFAGYLHIRYANPTTPLSAGVSGLGGYTLAFVNDSAYVNDKILDVWWTGLRYSVTPALDVTAAYYGYHQNAYGTGKQAGCATTASSTCSGSFEAFSFAADYHFTRRFDSYLGAMYSGVHDGVASGYAFYTTNINPTAGVRYKF